MTLSSVEKTVGRRFRTDCQSTLDALNEAAPPTYTVPFFIAVYRHPCPARDGKSTALELLEHYRHSTEDDGVPAGRFGFIYRQGKCRACGAVARSAAGRVVDAHQRPPLRIPRSGYDNASGG